MECVGHPGAAQKLLAEGDVDVMDVAGGGGEAEEAGGDEASGKARHGVAEMRGATLGRRLWECRRALTKARTGAQFAGTQRRRRRWVDGMVHGSWYADGGW